MKKPKLEVSATRKNDDWVTVDEMKQEERIANTISKDCVGCTSLSCSNLKTQCCICRDANKICEGCWN